MKKLSSTKGATGAAITAALALGTLQGSAAGSVGGESASTSTSASPTVCVGTQPVRSLPGPGTEVGPPDSTPLYRVLAYVDRTARARHSTVFTGLSVDDGDRAADVYRIPSKAFDADICGAAEKGVTVRLHDTDISQVDLDALAARISADMDRWNDTFQLRAVGVDSAGFVFVGVDDPAAAEPVLSKAFGRKHIRVEHMEQARLYR
ncbi:hypothetical protein [Streptomyces sp. NPDC050704]|uniref:hypothetical protein n=1 Tax=Streptomyces sp. NPDC050704 TaxID=3157219 RepID=UPI00343F9960